MADQHTPAPGIETEATIHTMPLPGEAKVMMFVEVNVSNAHEQWGSHHNAACVLATASGSTTLMTPPCIPVPQL